jgi:hypothetical protein
MARLQGYQISLGSLAVAILRIATKGFRAAAMLLCGILQHPSLNKSCIFFLNFYHTNFFGSIQRVAKSRLTFMFRSGRSVPSDIFETMCGQLINCVRN